MGADLDANCGTGRAFISAARTESRTKSCITLCWRKRTSVFEGCTLTSTSPAGQFEEQQHHGKDRRRQDVAVGLGDGVLHQAVADQASVHEDVDRVAVELLDFGLGDEAVQRGVRRDLWRRRLRPSSSACAARAEAAAGRCAPAAARRRSGISWSSTSLPKTWYTRSLYPATGGATSMALVAECSSKCLSGCASA